MSNIHNIFWYINDQNSVHKLKYESITRKNCGAGNLTYVEELKRLLESNVKELKRKIPY